MGHRFHMVTLGCDKNRVDAEIMVAKLLDAGYLHTQSPSKADFAIINTCAFIDDAKEESINEILNMAMYKGASQLKHIIVTGCLAERYKELVAENFPGEVDAVLGLGANKDIVSVVDEVMNGKKIQSFPSKYELPLEGKRTQSTPPNYAYIKIAEGCNNHCTYCAIPGIRGELRSRDIDDIVKQAKVFVSHGVKELVLIAQDTTAYGEDIYDKPALVDLLKELVKIDDLVWIRLLYCYPQRITDDLLEIMAKEEKIANYLDIPMQHCNEKVLRDMNRPGDVESLARLIDHIREKVPGIVIRTSFIVGFPGESKEEFVELLNFAKNMRFERLGCFSYSQEEDTVAGKREDQLSDKDKIARKRSMQYQQAMLTDEYNKKVIDKVFDVMHQGFDRNTELFYGRSYHSAPVVDPFVFYELKEDIEPGTMIKVKIVGSNYSDLLGEVIDYGREPELL